MSRVCVDFDKTLTTGEGPPYWRDDNEEYPNEDVVEYVRDRYHSGDTIIVWTARPWSQAHRIVSHLTAWQVPYHGVRCEKGGADVYVDDKALRPSEL